MGELNVMKKALRQRGETAVKQSKIADGYYKFYVKSEGIDAETELRYVIDINAYPVASSHQTDIYVRKGSDEIDEENNHYAVLDIEEQVELERKDEDILDLMFHNEFDGIIDREEYEELIYG